MLVEKIIGNLQYFETEHLKVDRVLFDHQDMAKPHQKRKTEMGETVAISLPHGEHLYQGAVLYQDEEKVIVVDLVPEDALKLFPQGNLQWAKTAFNIGNMHHPAYLHEDYILIPYDPILEKLMQGIGVAYERCQTQLQGEKASITVGGHNHHHHE